MIFAGFRVAAACSFSSRQYSSCFIVDNHSLVHIVVLRLLIYLWDTEAMSSLCGMLAVYTHVLLFEQMNVGSSRL